MKLLKQAGTAALASALLFSYVPQVWANDVTAAVPSSAVMTGKDGTAVTEAKISKEQAIDLAKTYITLPEGYTLQSINLYTYSSASGAAIPSWNLSYTRKVKDQYLGNINISIDGMDGKLTSYYFNDSDPDHKPSYPPKVNYQGAKETAAKWLAKINPDKLNELLYNSQNEQSFRTPLNGNFQYNIRYDRTVDGIPFPQNGVSIGVNSEGVVTSYSSQWDDSAVFEKVPSPISLDKAIQAFRDKANISLVYQLPYQSKGVKKPIISYSMTTNFLNAATGEPWSPAGYDLPTKTDAKPLTDQPLGTKPAANLNLTKEKAIQKVQETVALPADAILQSASFNESTDPETGERSSSWNMNWNQAPADPASGALVKIRYSINATVNAQTGELINYNHYIPIMDGQNNEVTVKVSQETAEQQAIDFVKKNLAAYTDQLVLDDSNLKAIPLDQQKFMRNWDFSFQRVIDGVNAGSERVYLSIDKATGDIVNYNFSFSTIEYPKQKPEVLPIEKAKDLLLSQYNIVLAYTPQYGNGMNGYGGIPYEKMNVMIAAGEIPPVTGGNTEKQPAKLVYMLVPKYTQQAYFLDAITGQWRDASTGEVTILDKINVSDIEGHWAQNELQLMVDYQALDVVDGQVNPNKVITRGEMIKMLVIAMNGGRGGINYGMERAASFKDVSNASPLFAYVENAVDRGLIDRGTDFNPDATMNREEMAQLVVRALGYKNLTKYNDIFNHQFTDAAAVKNIGEVAIVVGLGIMTLTDGSFKPAEEVTRAQAATAFFRYLQKRADLQDSPSVYY